MKQNRTKAKTAGLPSGHPVCLFTCCTYHWVELWLFRWPPGLQGAQSSRGVSLFTPFAGGTALVATGVGDAVGLSPSSPPNTGHSIHVFCPCAPPPAIVSSRFSRPNVTPLVLFPLSQNGVALSSPPPRLLALVFFAPLAIHPFSGRKGWAISFRGLVRVTARVVTTAVAGELRSSADVASPRLDADDDDVDVHARSPARDAGAYHGTEP